MKIYVNVMELLIEQEIVKYLKQPQYKHLRGEIVSLMTYALNRVPPIYASSVQGLKSQINRGKQDYNSHIENAVRWSFTAVNKAPRQKSPDLTREIYQRVLAETRSAVKKRELSPIDLPEMIDSMVPAAQEYPPETTCKPASEPEPATAENNNNNEPADAVQPIELVESAMSEAMETDDIKTEAIAPEFNEPHPPQQQHVSPDMPELTSSPA